MVPDIRVAIEHGIADNTYRQNNSIIPSYRGSVEFSYNGRPWAAVGYPPVIVKGEVVRNGYVEIRPLSRTILRRERSKPSLLRRLMPTFH